MFDRNKLEAFLRGLEVETHMPEHSLDTSPGGVFWPSRGAYARVQNPSIEQLMDKYDIFRNRTYKNVGTSEIPIWAPPESLESLLNKAINAYIPMPVTYGYATRKPFWSMGIGYAGWGDDRETPQQRLRKKVERLQAVKPVHVPDPSPRVKQPARAPDLVHVITGWRAWSIDRAKLIGLGSEVPWEPRRADRAVCVNNSHDAPQMKCACGFWAFRTFELMMTAIGSYTNYVKAVGLVDIWGRVIECENGFRAEYAYPKEIWIVDTEHNRVAPRMSYRYGVPIRMIGGE